MAAEGTSFSERFPAAANPEPAAETAAEPSASSSPAPGAAEHSSPGGALAANADSQEAPPPKVTTNGEQMDALLEERPPNVDDAKVLFICPPQLSPSQAHLRSRLNAVPVSLDPTTGESKSYNCCCAPKGLYDNDLAQYGVGTWLYFRDLKRLAWLFFGLACVATPVVLINLSISGKKKQGCPDGNPAMCTLFTMMGNVPGPTDELWKFGIGSASVLGVALQGLLMGKDLFFFYSMSDAIYSIALIFFINWWRRKQKEDVLAQDQLAVTMSDFTLIVKGVPAASEESGGLAGRLQDVRQFLEKLAGELAEAAGETDSTPSVVEMTAGLKQQKLLKLYSTRATMYRDLLKAEGKHKQKPTESSEKSIKEKREKFRDIDTQIEQEANKLQDGGKIPALYVTFDDAEDAERLAAAYKGCKKYFCQSVNMRYEGKRLSIKRAPEPTNVIWQNLGHTGIELFARRSFTMLFSAAILAVSAVLLYFSKQAKAHPPAPDCRSLVCAAQYDLVQPSPESSTAQLMTAYTWNRSPFNLTCSSNATTLFFRRKTTNTVPSGCIDASTWCLAALSFDEMSKESTVCEEAIAKNFENQALMFIPIVAVPVINAILKALLRILVMLEKQTSLSKESAAIATKLFLTQFLNTAILTFALSTKAISDGIQKAKDAAVGPAGDPVPIPDAAREFEIQWYAETGTALFFTLLLNAFTPKAISLVVIKLVGGLKRCLLKGSKKNQLELNKLYEPPEFKMAEQYAQLLNTCFCVLFFSSGMPMLLHIAAVDLTLTLLTDRWLFYHGYRKPPQYDESLAVQASELLYWAAPIHLVLACWTYTADFVQSGQNGIIDASTISGGDDPGGFGWLLGRALGRWVGTPTLLVLAGWAACEALSSTFMLGMIAPAYQKCKNRNKIAPEGDYIAKSQPLLSDADRIINLGFTRAVRHIAKYGKPTYQLAGNESYADAFETKPAPESFQTWRSQELEARLVAIADGTAEAEGPLLLPRDAKPPPMTGAQISASPVAIRALTNTTWEAVGGWRDVGGWIYSLSLSFGSVNANSITGVAEWTLKVVPEQYLAEYGEKIGTTASENATGMVTGRQVALDGDAAESADISQSTFRLVLCESEVDMTPQPDEDGIMERNTALLDTIHPMVEHMSSTELEAQHMELKGSVSGTKVRLLRVSALPDPPSLSPRDVTGDTPRNDIEALPAAQP